MSRNRRSTYYTCDPAQELLRALLGVTTGAALLMGSLLLVAALEALFQQPAPWGRAETTHRGALSRSQ
jgi:hypothetical protein